MKLLNGSKTILINLLYHLLQVKLLLKEKRMGHAGAIVSGNKGTASAKIEALTDAGANVVENPTRIGQAIKDVDE